MRNGLGTGGCSSGFRIFPAWDTSQCSESSLSAKNCRFFFFGGASVITGPLILLEILPWAPISPTYIKDQRSQRKLGYRLIGLAAPRGREMLANVITLFASSYWLKIENLVFHLRQR